MLSVSVFVLHLTGPGLRVQVTWRGLRNICTAQHFLETGMIAPFVFWAHERKGSPVPTSMKARDVDCHALLESGIELMTADGHGRAEYILARLKRCSILPLSS